MASVKSRIRALERQFAKERAEIAVNRFVYALIIRWDDFMAAGMDSLAIVRKLRIDLRSADTWSGAVRYIDKCIDEGRPPDDRILANTLAPWAVSKRR